MYGPIPEYVLADMKALAETDHADEPALYERIEDLLASACEWRGVRVEPIACNANRGLSARDLVLLRGHLSPLFAPLDNQHGGHELTVAMTVSRVRKIRHAVYPPTPELAPVSGLIRTAESEVLRRKLRAESYPEPLPSEVARRALKADAEVKA